MTDTTVSAPLARTVAGATAGDYLALLKPRIMALVVMTGIAGLVAAPGTLHPVLALTAVICIALGAGAAGAINMWYDRDIDAVMSRTRARPIPSGRVAPDDALAFGVVLAVGAPLVMGLAVNWLAAGLLAAATLVYVGVYTIGLKRRTPHNIVIGGAAGAFPPLIGWAAVTGELGLPALVLFLLIFFWTPPHFWALSLYRSADYAAAGVPMLPVVAGARATKRQLLIYTALLWPLAVAPYAFGLGGAVYLGVAFTLGGLFLVQAVRVWRDAGEQAARAMFGFSILFLFGVFAALIAGEVVPPAVATLVAALVG